MEDMNHSHQGEQTGYISVILMAIAIFSRSIEAIMGNYDYIFKMLSIISLVLVCAVNMGKLIEQLATAIDKVKTIFKRKKNE